MNIVSIASVLPARVLAAIDVVLGVALLLLDLAPGLFNPWQQPLGVLPFGAALLIAGLLGLYRPAIGLVIAAGSGVAAVVALARFVLVFVGEWHHAEGFGKIGIVVFTIVIVSVASFALSATVLHGVSALAASPDRRLQVGLGIAGSAIAVLAVAALQPGSAPALSAAPAHRSTEAHASQPTRSLEQQCNGGHPTACGDLFWQRYRVNDLEGMKRQSGVLCDRGIAYHCFALGDVAQALGLHDEAARYYDRGCARDPAHCRRQRSSDPGPLP
jgi:hypothetical protein